MVSSNSARRQDNGRRATNMTRWNSFRYIGYIPKLSPCGSKMRFRSRSDAESAAHEYNRRVVFADVQAYGCRVHWCWHIGHRDKHRYSRAKLRQHVEWFWIWERRN